MGIIDKIKRIIQGFNKEIDFIIEEKPSEDESPEYEDQINGS